MLGTWRARLGAVFAGVGVGLLGLSALGAPEASAANALTGWSAQGGIANWQVQPDGDSVYVVAPDPNFPHTNGQASFFVSPFETNNRTFNISMTAHPEADDDYMGLVVGYTSPIGSPACSNNNPCDTGFYLFDWKQATEVEGGDALPPEDGGQAGFSLMHVEGPRDLKNPDTSSHPNCLWTHEDVAGFCDVLGTDFGPSKGYSNNIEYTFQVTYKPTQIKIVLLGTGGNANRTIFDVAPPGGTTFPTGRLGFYNYSQPEVEYAYDDLTTPATSTTTTTIAGGGTTTTLATTPTTTGSPGTTIRTNTSVGPVQRSTLVRTGALSTIQLIAGVMCIGLGAMLTAARGRRPEGLHFRA